MSPEAKDAHAAAARSRNTVLIFPPDWFLSYIIGGTDGPTAYIYTTNTLKIASTGGRVKEEPLAVVVKKPRESRVQQSGASGLREALLAGPASGCSRFTVRRITLAPGGRTARNAWKGPVFYFLHIGRAALSHGEGELDHLAPGEAAVVHGDELHHFQNIGDIPAVILAVMPQ